MCQMGVNEPPRSKPLLSVDELLSWTPESDEDNEFCRGLVALPQASSRSPEAPKLLVCHDMGGGYREDAWANGCKCSNPFYMTHWHLIDTFVYFSHSFVTIPPPGWITCAHTHNTQVLGTLITEWDAGRKECEAFLATDETAEHTARQLARIAAYFRFDGWLLNIENELNAALTPRLLFFIGTLKAAMQEVHNRGQVIWYEAVTIQGKLKWQNTLNADNRPFFDASDAIFVNYAWKAETPAEVAKEAGDRARDVYMGIDVFGRGTYAGGQLNSYVAAAAALQKGLSVALFAVGWVYEGEGHDRSAWRQRDRELWDSLAAVLPAPKPLITRLPFESDFNTGYGAALFSQGKNMSPGPCFNLSQQAVQPLFQIAGRVEVSIGVAPAVDASIKLSHVEASVSTDLAYQGLSCLQIKGSVARGCPVSLDLFTADAELLEGAYLETIVNRKEQGHIAIDLLDDTGACLPLSGAGSQRRVTPKTSWVSQQQQLQQPGRLRRISLTCSSGDEEVASIYTRIGLIRLKAGSLRDPALQISPYMMCDKPGMVGCKIATDGVRDEGIPGPAAGSLLAQNAHA